MKKFTFIIAFCLFSVVISAQNSDVNYETLMQSRQEMIKQHQSRVPMKKNYPIQAGQKVIGNQSKSDGQALPSENWFPGEWEEVQAIVVTCFYEYYPIGHVSDQYYWAAPIFPHCAEYLHYSSNSWQTIGFGDYVGVMDTVSERGKVFFYVIDAIQLGNAEAWVRIESASDSNIVKRQLNRMNLRSNKLKFIVGPGNSYWYRDCGPICFYYGEQDNVGMVDFDYYPTRVLDDDLPSLIQQQKGIPNYRSAIEWEGGNCLVDGAGMVISSDAIYEGNEDTVGRLVWDGSNPASIRYMHKQALSPQQVYDSLHHIFDPRVIYILPKFRYDGGTGHIDLYMDMYDENGFVFSQFPSVYSNWDDYKIAAKNIDSLCSYQSFFGNNYKHQRIPFPCTDNGGNFTSQNSYDADYTRTYSNHTFVNNVLIQPVFSTVVNGVPSKQWDAIRLEDVKAAYPGYTVYPIDVSTFDGFGGAIHCITKQIPAENPIRILHPSITGNTEDMYTEADAAVTCIITNRSGIESASCFYRVDGGEWNEIILDAFAGDTFDGFIPTSSIVMTGNYARIDYYISATSNNGKTMTKPITANQGGYYTFYLGHNPSLGINNIAETSFGQFYPNPANDVANIAITLNEGQRFDVNIFNMAGQRVHRSQLDVEGGIIFHINTSNFAAGMYNVIFQGENGQQIVRKLIVK